MPNSELSFALRRGDRSGWHTMGEAHCLPRVAARRTASAAAPS